MDALHDADYDITKALCKLAPRTGPVLCRDEMEEWSASEANLFEEALDKYGKDFTDIRQDFVSTDVYFDETFFYLFAKRFQAVVTTCCSKLLDMVTTVLAVTVESWWN